MTKPSPKKNYQQFGRPSSKEQFKKIGQAKKFIEEDAIDFVHPEKVVEDFMEFNCDCTIEEDITDVLLELLNTITPERDYIGKKPPEKSYELETDNLDLFCN